MESRLEREVDGEGVLDMIARGKFSGEAPNEGRVAAQICACRWLPLGCSALHGDEDPCNNVLGACRLP